MEVNNDDMDLLSDSSDWSSSDDSDIDELLQDDDVEMMSLLVDVQAFEDRVKLMDQRRGSKMGRLTIYRNRALGHEHLMQDYFAEVPTYPPRLFRRRYQMRRSLFVKIVTDCEAASYYFKRRRSAAGIMGFSAYQKISAAMWVLAYGIFADYTDEYLRIGQDTTTESVRRFAKLVIRLYGEQYLQAPNEEDTKIQREMISMSSIDLLCSKD
ncbi:Cell division cycle 5-like protein [Hordeum vulgare]|nr:Cell division cycle 5-like protein [Hordeum vulgare]